MKKIILCALVLFSTMLVVSAPISVSAATKKIVLKKPTKPAPKKPQAKKPVPKPPVKTAALVKVSSADISSLTLKLTNFNNELNVAKNKYSNLKKEFGCKPLVKIGLTLLQRLLKTVTDIVDIIAEIDKINCESNAGKMAAAYNLIDNQSRVINYIINQLRQGNTKISLDPVNASIILINNNQESYGYVTNELNGSFIKFLASSPFNFGQTLDFYKNQNGNSDFVYNKNYAQEAFDAYFIYALQG
jgi:hypothetical protein